MGVSFRVRLAILAGDPAVVLMLRKLKVSIRAFRGAALHETQPRGHLRAVVLDVRTDGVHMRQAIAGVDRGDLAVIRDPKIHSFLFPLSELFP
jgi:hypothetical protein